MGDVLARESECDEDGRSEVAAGRRTPGCRDDERCGAGSHRAATHADAAGHADRAARRSARDVPPVTSPQSQVFGKVLSVEDAVTIALETQPNIKARISDYIASAFRVDQALAPLFPQITGSWTVARDQQVAAAC